MWLDIPPTPSCNYGNELKSLLWNGTFNSSIVHCDKCLSSIEYELKPEFFHLPKSPTRYLRILLSCHRISSPLGMIIFFWNPSWVVLNATLECNACCSAGVCTRPTATFSIVSWLPTSISICEQEIESACRHVWASTACKWCGVFCMLEPLQKPQCS